MNLQDTGIASVDEFINAFNARDPQRWAASLNYPHVRPSQGTVPAIAVTAADYLNGVDFQHTIRSGWDHSEWDYRRVLHVSEKKIHVAGQWSRYNSAAEIILTRPIVYIVTCVEAHWGIQARFATDGLSDDGAEETEREAFNVIKAFVRGYNNKSMASCAALLNYPHIEVDAGTLTCLDGPADFAMTGNLTMQIDSMMAVQTGHNAINVAIEVTLFDELGLKHAYLGVILLTRESGPLGIKAWSFIND